MENLKYAVHAYSWTSSWSNKTLDLIDRAKKLGFDLIEIPLMELNNIDPEKIRKSAENSGIGICTSTALSLETDITSDLDETRKRGLEYLKKCVEVSSEMNAESFSGVIYSAIGRKIDKMPEEKHWKWSATILKDVAKFANKFGIILGIEPVNRYETFLVNTCDQAMNLMKTVGENNVKIHLDSYHMNIEENDFYNTLVKAIPYLCHFHLSESHRGTPGTGTIDWEAIYRALSEMNYTGLVGLESFIEVSNAMREATCIWRPLASSSDKLLSDGLLFLKNMEKKYYKG